MTERMTQLEYAKSYAPASRIPESFLTMGDVVELLERIEELKAEVKNLDEGAKLLHSVAMNGEQSVLSRLDNGVDAVDAQRWQDGLSIDEVKRDYTFNTDNARSIALPNGQLRSYATYKNTGKAQPLRAEDVDGERLGE